MENQEYKKMVLILFACTGAEEYEFYHVPVEMAVNERKMDDFAWERAVDFASSYGIYPEYDRPEDYDEDEDIGRWGGDIYSDDISGYWEEYNPEKHDKHTIRGVPEWQKV